MTKPSPTPRTWLLILLSISAIPLIVQIAAASSSAYGYFIDELYYLACARHLAAGYVDHPPLAPLVLAGVRLVLGESRLAIRILPFLAGSAIAGLGGLLALELGGGLFAMALAALTIGLAPGLLALCGFYSMNAFEPLIWTLVILLSVRLARSHDVRLWLPIGITVGIGLENKHTLLVYVAALGAGILATSARRLLATRWFLIGGAAAAALILPNLLWQMTNGWPSLEFYRNAQALKNAPTPPLWDSGLRPVPPRVLRRAQTAATTHMRNAERLSLDHLAREFGVHERTLRAAARTSRLQVTFSSRSAFGRPIRLATRAAVQAFIRKDYRRYGGQSPARAPLPSIPCDYDARLKRLRRRLRLTQHDLARRIGAANKAVVYQWESRQRTPSPVFWKRVEALAELVGIGSRAEDLHTE